jgi:hypothetical protein
LAYGDERHRLVDGEEEMIARQLMILITDAGDSDDEYVVYIETCIFTSTYLATPHLGFPVRHSHSPCTAVHDVVVVSCGDAAVISLDRARLCGPGVLFG